MDVLIGMLNNIARLDPNEELNKVLSKQEVQKEIVELNTINQLYEEGVRADNSLIGKYAPSTIRYKESIGARHDHITLHDLGDYYKSHKVTLEPKAFDINANPMVGATNLFDVYGSTIVGLTDESKEILQEQITPLLTAQILQDVLR